MHESSSNQLIHENCRVGSVRDMEKYYSASAAPAAPPSKRARAPRDDEEDKDTECRHERVR